MEVIVTAQVSLLPAAMVLPKVSVVFLITITRSAGLGSCMKLEVYHWPELPQVWFLLQQKFCCNKHVFVMTSMCLSWQKVSFVATEVCLLWQNFCHDKQRYACHKKSFVATKIFCHDKHNFVTTKLLSWQAYFCHNKRRVLVVDTMGAVTPVGYSVCVLR